MKILQNIKKKFERESDVDILKNPLYSNRMKFILITLRDKYKSKYAEVIASRYHKKTIVKQDRFINELGLRAKHPLEYHETSMRKQFLKDYPKYRKLVRINCLVELVE
jgi:hypothetical protein